MKNEIIQIPVGKPLLVLMLFLCSVFASSLGAGDNQPLNFSNHDAALWYRGFSPEQEIRAARTLNTKVFVTESGMRIYRIFAHPVHEITEHGKLEDRSDSCVTCDSWQVGESYSGYIDGLFEELYVCGQTATYIQVNDTYFLRGFVEFTTDAVPDTAIIDSLTLSLYCVQWPIYNEDHDIWSMETRPSTSTAMAIYYDAMDGDCYVDNYLGGTGWNSWELDSIAIETFTNQLLDDWFAVGISDFTSASAYYLLYQCSTGYIDVVELGIAEEKPKVPPLNMALEIEPNPFSSTTTITFERVSDHQNIGISELHIYDITGREVKKISLLPFSFSHGAKATWDGRDAQGNQLPSGTYFCRAIINGLPFTQKIHLVR